MREWDDSYIYLYILQSDKYKVYLTDQQYILFKHELHHQNETLFYGISHLLYYIFPRLQAIHLQPHSSTMYIYMERTSISRAFATSIAVQLCTNCQPIPTQTHRVLQNAASNPEPRQWPISERTFQLMWGHCPYGFTSTAVVAFMTPTSYRFKAHLYYDLRERRIRLTYTLNLVSVQICPYVASQFGSW